MAKTVDGLSRRWEGQALGERVALLLILVPLVLELAVVVHFGVNTVFGDEFYYTDFIRTVREGGDWTPWILRQHNEHRVVPMKLVMAPLALATDWDTRAEMAVSVLLTAGVVAALFRMYRRAGGKGLLAFVPVPWLVCVLSQFQTLLYGMMMCFVFTVLGVIWAIALLRGRGASLLAAVLSAVMATFSTLNGFLVWPLGAAVLAVRRRWPALAIWLAGAAACAWLYFRRFDIPPNTDVLTPGAEGLFRFAAFTVTLLGAPLGLPSVVWSGVIGLGVLFAVGAVAWSARRGGWSELERVSELAAVVLFALMTAAVVALGRASDMRAAVESRYVTMIVVGLAAAWLLLVTRRVERVEQVERRGPQPLLFAALGLLVPGLLAANIYGWKSAREWSQARLGERFVLQTFESQPPGTFGSPEREADVRRSARYMKEARLGAFAGPSDLLLLLRWQEGVTGNDILPGAAVQQELICPVGTLRDVGVTLAGASASTPGTVVLSLSENGRLLAQRSVVINEIGGRVWLELPLRSPLRGCEGRHLLLEVACPAGRPGATLTAWFYPDYYPGEPRQAGNNRLLGRDLGVALNAFSAGILR